MLAALVLAASTAVPALAAEEVPEESEVPAKTIIIDSVRDFEDFARHCVRDVYSENLIVSLEADLDFKGKEFTAVPSFSGIFEGNRHTIKGITLNTEGSVQGLFRYLTETAVVKDLTVSGTFQPEGTKNSIGSIAGNNAGTILNCKFQGSCAGTESVGGIAGFNQVSGILENCMVSGNISGSHFVGGIAGSNYGTIRKCRNLSSVNTREEENKIESVSFDPEFIMGKEAVDTVTDLGGIAGTSSGVIRDCVNHGNIGYPHMGYNLGGICGTQRGYVTGCKNQGKIQGRKEVGGIAGQLEPVVEITYTEDTLQILRRQLDTTSSLANRASANIKSNSQSLSADIGSLHSQAEVALDAIRAMLPQDGEFPDQDTITSAHNSLSSSVGSMQGTIGSLNQSAQSVVSTAAGDIRAITNSVNDISHTLDTAADHLGGTITDVSDEDTEDQLTGKIQDCHNAGAVFGDLNIGGIAGAVAWENDRDPDEDYTVTGDRSLNFDSRLRAVVLDCTNAAKIQAGKRNAGGITGNLSLGLARNCTNTGVIDSEDADYAGGIAGTSLGFIRSCNVKCRLLGHSYVGGIAGSASIVSDCRSTVMLEGSAERLGSVLGITADDRTNSDSPISGNYYLPLADHLGAIDGIDYYEMADSLTKQQFLDLKDLNAIFLNATMTFLYPDGSTQKISVPMGQVIPESKIPEPPRKEGYISKWDQLEDLDLRHMFFNVTLEAEYTATNTVVESEQTRYDGKPVLLAEGSFGETETVTISPLSPLPDSHPVTEAWTLPDLGTEEDSVIHLTIPQGMNPQDARVLILRSDGSWEEVPGSRDGSYMTFTAGSTDQGAAVYESHGRVLWKILSIAGSCLGLILVITLIVMHRKRRKTNKPSEENA